ncbi:NYN domain-containing protein [Pseudoclavibacter alba]|uniref:NYN domain-containing protein n=1 Tax=Pseudoclavibacter albus TaxID=272241 RepID=A0ABT2HUE1_9MICO|nr:NYN domain-containing protein [Pseudoclavibacter alba]MCT2041931.1 NYN domain-containing protein [Pseudoclavibacter alba]
MIPVPGPAPLRAVVIVDYQNIHMTARDAFPHFRHLPPHESLVDPLVFARRLIDKRNARQGEGYRHATLSRVHVYRGLPSNRHDPEAYAWNLANKAEWERTNIVTVHHRPLRYDVERDARGAPIRDIHGREIVHGKREKGIDVLCALALVREVAKPDVDLVIMASHDSDLAPALDEAIDARSAKVETFRWQSPDVFVHELRPTKPRVAWCTRLDATDFAACVDRRTY